jgi:hypothetical protein
MSGQAGGRGYLLQSLICLLNLARERGDWDTVTLEPNFETEKVDICLTSKEGVKIIQIKSSQNAIGLPDVQRWANALEVSMPAEHYELFLIGPCSDQVSKTDTIGKVKIPTPFPLNIKTLIEQSAHQLDGYFEIKGISRVPPFAREILVNALVTKLSTYATKGTPLSHSDLDKLLNEWVLELYPQSVNKAVEMQCTVLWDLIAFPTRGKDFSSIQFITQLVFRNDGIRTAVIDNIAIVISKNDVSLQYGPTLNVNLNRMIAEGRSFTMKESEGLFMEFAVSPGETCKVDIVFVHAKNPARPASIPALTGTYSFDLYAFFADREEPVLLRSKILDLNKDLYGMFDGLGSKGGNVVARFRKRTFNL